MCNNLLLQYFKMMIHESAIMTVYGKLKRGLHLGLQNYCKYYCKYSTSVLSKARLVSSLHCIWKPFDSVLKR